MTVMSTCYLTPASHTQMHILFKDGFTPLTKWLSFSLNPSAFQKGKVRGYLAYSSAVVQFCSFSRLSSTIDWNGFASLTICIAQSFSSSHLFTQSLKRHITPAIKVNRHYHIYFISTDWGSASLATNMKQLFHPNHITTKNKIDQLLFSPKSDLWWLCWLLCSLTKVTLSKRQVVSPQLCGAGGEFFLTVFLNHIILIAVFLLD